MTTAPVQGLPLACSPRAQIGWATFDLRSRGFPSRVHLAAQPWLFSQVFFLVRRSEPPRTPEGAPEDTALAQSSVPPAQPPSPSVSRVALEMLTPVPRRAWCLESPGYKLGAQSHVPHHQSDVTPASGRNLFSWGCASDRFNSKTLQKSHIW